MRAMLRAIATRTESLAGPRGAAPRYAGSLLALAGALLVVALPLAALHGGLSLGPLVLWLSAMAVLGAAVVVAMAALRVRRLERALARERARFRALAEAVPAGVCQFDQDGGLVFSNAACEALFGGVPQTCPTSPCGGGPIFRSLPPDERARLRDRWEAAGQDGKPFTEDLRLVTDGVARRVSLTAVPVAEGGRLGYVCCLAERDPRPISTRPATATLSRMA